MPQRRRPTPQTAAEDARVSGPVGLTPPPATVDGARLIAVLAALVEPLGRSLPATTEVVLHDLSRLPNSIVAVHGDVTGRRVGDPATDLLLEWVVQEGAPDHMVGYETRLPDGRRLRSSTMIVRDADSNAVAALCVNSDLELWSDLGRVVASMVGSGADVAADGTLAPAVPEGSHRAARRPAPLPPVRGRSRPESFPRDVDELAAQLIHDALEEEGVPVTLMKKEHKLRVVHHLEARGIFLLRDAVEMVATALGVTRFTIYNYLNELTDAAAGVSRGGRNSPSRRKDA